MTTFKEAAYQLGRDDVLNDPTDAEIVLAAAELAKGNWPEDFSVDRHLADEIVKSWEKGYAERERQFEVRAWITVTARSEQEAYEKACEIAGSTMDRASIEIVREELYEVEE